VGAWATVLGVMALVAAPHYALAWRGEWAYVRGTLTGEGVEMWGYRGTWAQHAAYYLTGPGGKHMLDGLRSLVPLGVAVGAYAWGTLAVLRRGGSRRRGAYLAAALAAVGMAWVGPTLAVVKIQQFASCFAALAWLVGVHAAAGVGRRAPRPWRRGARGVVGASVLVAGLLATRVALYRWTFPLWPSDRTAPARAVRDARDEFVRRAYAAVRAEAGRGARSIVAAGAQTEMDGPLLRLWLVRDGLALGVGSVKGVPRGGDAAEAERRGRAAMDGYDLVLVSRGVARTDRPTVIKVEADGFYLGLARTDERLELANRETEPATGAVFELYRRKRSR
jgi:hypothetical protein